MHSVEYLYTLNEEERKKYLLNYLLNEKDENARNAYINAIMNDKNVYKSLLEELRSIIDIYFNREICNKILTKRNHKEEVSENYNKLLANYALLSKELKLDNSLKIAIFYTYLLWNGYFSYDKTNTFKYIYRKRNLESFSYDVMNGIGVCLNYSNLLNDYLYKCGVNSAILLSELKNSTLSIDFLPEIAKNCSIESIEEKITRSKTNKENERKRSLKGDHAFNLIEDNGRLYIYDPTNFLLLKPNENNKADLVNGTGTIKVYPISSYVLNPNDNSIKVLNNYIVGNNLKVMPYSKKEYKEYWLSCLELIKENLSLIEDAYDLSYIDIITIADYTRKRKI